MTRVFESSSGSGKVHIVREQAWNQWQLGSLCGTDYVSREHASDNTTTIDADAWRWSADTTAEGVRSVLRRSGVGHTACRSCAHLYAGGAR